MTAFTTTWTTVVLDILDDMGVETFVAGRHDDIIYAKTDECKRFSITAKYGIDGSGNYVDLVFTIIDPCYDVCSFHIDTPNFGDFVAVLNSMTELEKSADKLKAIKKTYSTQLESIQEFISIYLDFWEG